MKRRLPGWFESLLILTDASLHALLSQLTQWWHEPSFHIRTSESGTWIIQFTKPVPKSWSESNYLRYPKFQSKRAFTHQESPLVHLLWSGPEESSPFKVKGTCPPQIFEPSGFWMQLSKDQIIFSIFTSVIKSFSASYHQLLNSNLH